MKPKLFDAKVEYRRLLREGPARDTGPRSKDRRPSWEIESIQLETRQRILAVLKEGYPHEPADAPREFDAAELSISTAFTSEELSQIDLEDIPYQSVVEVFNDDGEKRYQLLEEKDPESVGLVDYRRGEINAIVDLLNDNDLVAIVGPSRSGKTEAILSNLYERNTGLDTLLNAHFVNCESYSGMKDFVDLVIGEMNKDKTKSKFESRFLY